MAEKKETAKERLERLQQQTAHNAASSQGQTPNESGSGPANSSGKSTPSLAAGEPAPQPSLEEAAQRETTERSSAAIAEPDSGASPGTLDRNSAAPLVDLEKRPDAATGLVKVEQKANETVEGKFVTDDELLLLTLQRADNRNINVRLDTDLANWFEDAVEDLAYECRMKKTDITTIAFRFLQANWRSAVGDRVAAAAGTSGRRRRR